MPSSAGRSSGSGEVADVLVEGRTRETLVNGVRLRSERAGVAIDGVDGAHRPQQVGQSERERTGARAQVRPHEPGALDALTDQADVVVVVHRGPSMPG